MDNIRVGNTGVNLEHMTNWIVQEEATENGLSIELARQEGKTCNVVYIQFEAPEMGVHFRGKEADAVIAYLNKHSQVL